MINQYGNDVNLSSNIIKPEPGSKKNLVSKILKISLLILYIASFFVYILYIFNRYPLKYFLERPIKYISSEEFLVLAGIFLLFLISLLFLYFTIRAFFRKKKIAFLWLIMFIVFNILDFFLIIIFSSFFQMNDKPVIYLYPTIKEEVQVKLDFKGTIFADYPAYDPIQKGWTVTAFPDGKIINSDGKEYSYLFWEGEPAINPNYDLSTGFVIKGEDTIKFLQEKLSELGLTPKEYNEFIVYWYPKMKDNKYNLIHFAKEEYTNTAPLTIIPKPDSMLRVFMVFKPLNKPIDIKPQNIESFTRTGFTVVEWGGTELNK